MKTFALIQAFLSLIAPNNYVMQNNIMQDIQARTDYTFYEYTTYMPSLEEVKELEENTYGTWKRTEKIKKYIYPWVTHFLGSEKYPNSEQKIVWVIPFYWPYDKIIAYEYIIACWDNVCGSWYQLFPWIKDEEKAMQELNKDFKCKDEYYCDRLSSGDMYWIETLRIPDVTPVSYRISKLWNYSWKIKFYHWIYWLDAENNKVYSLDKDDKNLTKDDIIKRLKELANPDNYSFTFNLLKEKARVRATVEQLTVKTHSQIDWWYEPNYTKEEIIKNRKTEKPFELDFYHKREWYFDIPSVLTWSYKIVNRNGDYLDILTWRALQYEIPFTWLTHYQVSL